jgi:hypothetical protein
MSSREVVIRKGKYTLIKVYWGSGHLAYYALHKENKSLGTMPKTMADRMGLTTDKDVYNRLLSMKVVQPLADELKALRIQSNAINESLTEAEENYIG